jgi:hypothetical protein
MIKCLSISIEMETTYLHHGCSMSSVIALLRLINDPEKTKPCIVMIESTTDHEISPGNAKYF